MHQPSDENQLNLLNPIIEALTEIEKQVPIVFPIHPRTKSCLEKLGLMDWLDLLTRPTQSGCLPFLKLVNHTNFILTDSGRIQGESAVLNVTCLTMKD